MEKEKSYERGFNYACYLLSSANKTEGQLRKKLKEKEYTPDKIDMIIEKLIELKYINDSEYVNSYLEYHVENQLYSKRQIIYKLQQKGIKTDLIKEILNDYDIDEVATLEKLVKKKLATGKEAVKVINYLMTKGFKYVDIKQAMQNINEHIEIEEVGNLEIY